jgi:hypothetical protein
MVNCYYCQDNNHNISSCKEDNVLIEMIMKQNTQPKFSSFSEKILRRLSAHCNIKTTLPKLQLVIQITRKWRELNNTNKKFKSDDTDCAICFETIETTNCCVTTCGHKYCLSCVLEHSRNRLIDDTDCPICRNVLLVKKNSMNDYTHIQDLIDNDFDNYISTQRSEQFRGGSFIYDGNVIERRDSVIEEIEMLETLFTESSTYNDIEELFTEPPVNIEIVRETYRN